MSYLLHVRKKNRNGFKKILLILLFCLILGYFARGFIVRSVVSISLGLKSVISFIVPSGFRSDDTVIALNDALRAEVLRLTGENADRNVLADENANLKFELGRQNNSTTTKTSKKTKSILAIIKEKPAETPFDTFIVDVGAEEGVAVGDNVYYGNLIIGKVVEVGSLFAKVGLFSSPGNTFSGTVSESKIKLDAKGLGGGMFESLVPQGVNVKIGDALILPSISSKVFGIIQSIEERQSEGFKRLLFTLPVNPNQISNVIIEPASKK
jgi:cell shape-determining protein MreC